MQLKGIFTSLFFVLLMQPLLGFSEQGLIEQLGNSMMFTNINKEQVISDVAAAQAFVQTARSAGVPDSEIVTKLINTLEFEKENAYSTTSYSLKNDVNNVWFFLGAMAMLGVISVGYLIYWLMQKKQEAPPVPPSSSSGVGEQQRVQGSLAKPPSDEDKQDAAKKKDRRVRRRQKLPV